MLRSERRFVSYSNVKSGMLLEFLYVKENTNERKQYRALVIDPSRKNEHANEEQLHGLLIDDLSDQELLEMIGDIGRIFKPDPKDRKKPITFLQTKAAYRRYLNKFFSDRRYRTFNRKNMSSIKQILRGKDT